MLYTVAFNIAYLSDFLAIILVLLQIECLLEKIVEYNRKNTIGQTMCP